MKNHNFRRILSAAALALVRSRGLFGLDFIVNGLTEKEPFDAAAFAFYRDGVVAGTDLLVPTQDVVSPVYMLISRVEDMEAEAASFAGEGYADGGEIALLSGQTARVFTLQREDVDYVAYLVEGEGAAFTLLTVCSTQAEDYALRLREVVDTFTLTPQSEAA